MANSILPLSFSAIAQPSLDSFRESARQGELLHLAHDGSEWKVLAEGVTPGQRCVAWVEPEVDTQSAFVAALGQAFSRGIQEAVVRELGLGPQPGQPLEARVVEQAIAMAETSHKALLGVDFMTQLMCSAVTHSAGFSQACQAQGLPVSAVNAQQREWIDGSMQKRFAEAASQGLSPVAPELAQQWLREEIAVAMARQQ